MIEDLINRIEALFNKKEIPYLYKSSYDFEKDLRKKIEYIKKKEKIKK